MKLSSSKMEQSQQQQPELQKPELQQREIQEKALQQKEQQRKEQTRRNNHDLLLEGLSSALIQRTTKPQLSPVKPKSGKEKRKAKSKKSKKSSPATTSKTVEPQAQDAENLGEFANYIATETFDIFPEELKNLDYDRYPKDKGLQTW